MGPEEIDRIKKAFKLESRDLAKALNVAPYTVTRWEKNQDDGGTLPTGLQAEVLQALHNVALETQGKKNEDEAKLIRGLILLGIGALIFYLLTNKKAGPAP